MERQYPTDEVIFEAARRSSSLRQLAERELKLPFSSFHRYLKNNPELDEAVRELLYSTENVDDGKVPTSYSFDGDAFVFDISFLEEPYRVPRYVWEGVCDDYPSSGGNMTKAQIAQKWDIPRKILETCMTKYGLYKANPPYTHERLLASENVDDLVSDSLEARQHRYQIEFQKRELAQMRRELSRLRQTRYRREQFANEVMEEFIQGIKGVVPPKEDLSEKDDGTRFSVHAPVVDLHIGKYVWGKEDYGDDYDTSISVGRLRRHGEDLARWISSQKGTCTDVYLSDLGDFVHSVHSSTESGTPLHQDSRNKKVWREALKAKIHQIECLRGVAERVHVHVALGNHAGFVEWLIQESLLARYEDTDDVFVSDNLKPQNYFLVGETLHILDHGKGINSLTAQKAKTQADVVAREITGDDYFKARQIVFYVGHLHELQVGSQGRHMTLMRLESMGESDEYESSLRYAGNPVAHAFVLDERGRIDTDKRFYIGSKERAA